ncbi:2902_t:CDS:2 [Acaulospora morrowiae]|uniref:DNA-directed RNA polymerase II subunit RPB9 n=1 Tax=Acaulospora morrowiae TaxID=94023 RepID=A0A9N9ACR2_9GLOM|nr:2902_t:CDS:2 [Acaulospora morrowiae]
MATFKFCSQCSNLLYPREDKENKRLLYACRNCIYQEETINFCVYRNDVQNAASEKISIIKDLAADPTLARKEKKCSQCGYNIAVFFEAQTRRSDTKMSLYYACANIHCGYRWTDLDQPPMENAEDQYENEENLEYQVDDYEMHGQEPDVEVYQETTYPSMGITEPEEQDMALPKQEYHDSDDW